MHDEGSGRASQLAGLAEPDQGFQTQDATARPSSKARRPGAFMWLWVVSGSGGGSGTWRGILSDCPEQQVSGGSRPSEAGAVSTISW